MFTKFLHDVEVLVTLLMHAFTRQCCILFWNAKAKSEAVSFDVCKKPLKFVGCHRTSFGLLQNLCQFYNPRTYAYQC